MGADVSFLSSRLFRLFGKIVTISSGHTGRRAEHPVSSVQLSDTGADFRGFFCKTCRSTIFTTLAQQEHDAGLDDSEHVTSSQHHRGISSLRQSALGGCRICLIIWYQLTRHKPRFLSLLPWYYATSFEVQSRRIRILHMWAREVCEFRTMRVPDDIEQARLPRQDLPGHTGSVESLDLARRWLRTCQDSHPECGSKGDPKFRPSRLLYLGDQHRVCLRIAQDYPNELTYMTLSHCWGLSRSTRLLRGNLDAFQIAVPPDALPQTFLDAIRIARHLGSDYLWIDSLCIIQDSRDDWQTESALMGDIYRNSLCNIAAAISRDGQGGCFFQRDPRMLRPVPLPDLSDGVLSPHDKINKYPSKGVYIYNGTNLDDSYHLYTRAWVLQEALLGPRTLHCATSQLYWSCDGMRASEEIPGGFTVHIGPHLNHPSRVTSNDAPGQYMPATTAGMRTAEANNDTTSVSIGPSTLEAFLYDQRLSSSSPTTCWGRVVSVYSRMDLTYESDRPIAIQGMVGAFRPFLGDYWAGMWASLVPGHLVWRTRVEVLSPARAPPLHCTRPKVKRAPSWSWMALEGSVAYIESL